MKESLLLTPGPTNVPARVLAKTALPMIHHRTKEFQTILERVNANLQKVFFTAHPVMTFAASGTGAMEATITNLLSKGDTVLSFSAGKWGERYRDIAKADLGAVVAEDVGDTRRDDDLEAVVLKGPGVAESKKGQVSQLVLKRRFRLPDGKPVEIKVAELRSM